MESNSRADPFQRGAVVACLCHSEGQMGQALNVCAIVLGTFVCAVFSGESSLLDLAPRHPPVISNFSLARTPHLTPPQPHASLQHACPPANVVDAPVAAECRSHTGGWYDTLCPAPPGREQHHGLDSPRIKSLLALGLPSRIATRHHKILQVKITL